MAHSLQWVATEPLQAFQEGGKAFSSHACDLVSSSQQFYFREIIMRTISISKKILLLAGVSLAALCLTLGASPKTIAGPDDLASWKFTPINFPGASATWANDMNMVGQLVGVYSNDVSGGGFLLSKGVFTPILVGDYNEANGINLTGEIVGWFWNQDGYHGYLLRKGKVTPIDCPVAGLLWTDAMAINDLGAIVGWYGVVDEKDTYTEHGFLLNHGVYTTIDYPGAFATNVRGINLQGDIVGIYTTVTDDPGVFDHGPFYGFLRKHDGTFTTISVGQCNGINLWGQIVGSHWDKNNICRGFLLSGGKSTSFSIPDATSTGPSKITPFGQHIVGTYWDQAGSPHGFLLSRKSSD
jgi:uncharacterized membrane protein